MGVAMEGWVRMFGFWLYFRNWVNGISWWTECGIRKKRPKSRMTQKCLTQISGRQALPFTEVCGICCLGYIRGRKSGAHKLVYCCFTKTPQGTRGFYTHSFRARAVPRLLQFANWPMEAWKLGGALLQAPLSLPHCPLWPWLMHGHPGVITAHLGTGTPS